jgi:hypothetical protein
MGGFAGVALDDSFVWMQLCSTPSVGGQIPFECVAMLAMCSMSC